MLEADMRKLEAVVKDGRLTLDEPTDLPEGSKVSLVREDPFEDLPDAERQRLHAALATGRKQHAEGLGIPLDQVLAKLRQR